MLTDGDDNNNGSHYSWVSCDVINFSAWGSTLNRDIVMGVN